MKLTIAYASLLYAAGLCAAAQCNANNCFRAVSGNLRDQASHFADCQSFFACTVTPAATTTTLTSTVMPPPTVDVVTAAPYPENKKRQAAAVTNCPSAVPTYASACSGTVRYSSACSCLGAPTSTTTLPVETVTVTTTTTLPAACIITTVAPAAPTLCGNSGLRWAYFQDSQDPGSLDPATHKKDTPSITGVTNELHFYSDEGNIYGQNLPGGGFVVEHRGYLFTPESGIYTFNATFIDENHYVWIGPRAYSGWARGNQQQDAHYSFVTGYGVSVFRINLSAGQYLPFRMVNSNRDGPGRWDFRITAPSGYVLIGNIPSAAKQTPYVVQYSCDGVLAPAYPAFGQET